nr:nucleotidyltransferase domain-containing protein [Candidatus Freyarchaeota archaeon]
MLLKNLEKIKQREYTPVIEEYLDKLHSNFGEKIVGVLLFGSVARGEAKPLKKYESDIDLIVLIRGIPENISERLMLKAKLVLDLRLGSRVQGFWMPPEELPRLVGARTGYIMDALTEGILLYDPEQIIEESKKTLERELRERGVEKKKYGWVWPLKAGEIIKL